MKCIIKEIIKKLVFLLRNAFYCLAKDNFENVCKIYVIKIIFKKTSTVIYLLQASAIVRMSFPLAPLECITSWCASLASLRSYFLSITGLTHPSRIPSRMKFEVSFHSSCFKIKQS